MKATAAMNAALTEQNVTIASPGRTGGSARKMV